MLGHSFIATNQDQLSNSGNIKSRWIFERMNPHRPIFVSTLILWLFNLLILTSYSVCAFRRIDFGLSDRPVYSGPLSVDSYLLRLWLYRPLSWLPGSAVSGNWCANTWTNCKMEQMSQGTSLLFSIIAPLNLLFLRAVPSHFTLVWAEPKLSFQFKDLENIVLFQNFFLPPTSQLSPLPQRRPVRCRWPFLTTWLLWFTLLNNWSSRTGQEEGTDLKIKGPNIAWFVRYRIYCLDWQWQWFYPKVLFLGSLEATALDFNAVEFMLMSFHTDYIYCFLLKKSFPIIGHEDVFLYCLWKCSFYNGILIYQALILAEA